MSDNVHDTPRCSGAKRSRDAEGVLVAQKPLPPLTKRQRVLPVVTEKETTTAVECTTTTHTFVSVLASAAVGKAPPNTLIVDHQIQEGLLRVVPGYFISNRGRVRRPHQLDTYGSLSVKGYLHVKLNGRSFSVHNLVLWGFDGLPTTGDYDCDHIDGNPSNNDRTNLEYVTHSENMRRSYRTNQFRKSCAEQQSKAIRGRKLGETEWTNYTGIQNAARALGINPGNVSRCCSGKRSHAGGHEFEFADAEDLMPEERVRDVIGLYPEGYKESKAQVTSMGRFRDSRGVIKTPSPGPDGYCQVHVYGKNRPIHVLIAEAFELPKVLGQTQVDHRNGKRSDNRLDNLCYVTPSINVSNSYTVNTERKSHTEAQGLPLLYRTVGSDWPCEPSFQSVHQAERQLGISYPSLIGHLKKRMNNASVGPIFGKHEFRYATRSPDLEGETWVPLLVPIDRSKLLRSE